MCVCVRERERERERERGEDLIREKGQFYGELRPILFHFHILAGQEMKLTGPSIHCSIHQLHTKLFENAFK